MKKSGTRATNFGKVVERTIRRMKDEVANERDELAEEKIRLENGDYGHCVIPGCTAKIVAKVEDRATGDGPGGDILIGGRVYHQNVITGYYCPVCIIAYIGPRK